MIRQPLLLTFLALGLAVSALHAEDAKRAPRFAFVGLHGGAFDELARQAPALGVELTYVPDADIAAQTANFSAFDIVFFVHFRAEDRDAYRALISAAREQNPKLRLFTLSGQGKDVLSAEYKIEEDAGLSGYYATPKTNLRRLLVYALVKFMGRTDLAIEPPEFPLSTGLYHPAHPGLFGTVAEWKDWCRGRDLDPDRMPHVAVGVRALHFEYQEPAVVDALVLALEKQGMLAAAIIDIGGPGREAYEALLREFSPDLVVHAYNSPDSVEFRIQLDIPHMQSLFFRVRSIREWREGPDGFTASEAAYQVCAQETLGAIEPQAGAGTLTGGGSAESMQPIPDRIDHIARRAAAWVHLRRTASAEKRVAIVYYDREAGKNELMRGSATGMFLNAPRSLLNVLRRMSEDGYRIDARPTEEDDLIARLMKGGRIVGVWAQEELDRLVREGSPALVPVARYEEWLRKRVPEDARRKLEDAWGPPPGRFMVWRDPAGQSFLVIPRVQLGNIMLLPQPLRGEANDSSKLHDRRVPPPHNYLATYFWLEEEFRADALIHFGTHGSEIALPGKDVGLCEADWPDILLGAVPNILPWTVENLGEAAVAKRRTYGVLVSHLPPPIVAAGISDELQNLHGDIDKWETLEAGALKAKFAATVTEGVRKAKLERDLGLEIADGRVLSDAEIMRCVEYLHRIENETTPVSLHVLGEPPPPALEITFLVTCLRKRFLNDLAAVLPPDAEALRLPGDRDGWMRKKAEEILEAVLRRGAAPADAIAAAGGTIPPSGLPAELVKGFKIANDLHAGFAQTPQEIDNLLRALRGGFIPPGPGNSPARNPASVPTGRNLYLLDPEEVPTRPSWELGVALVDKMLADYRTRHGRIPVKVGFDLSSFATFRDYGVMEAQILYLLGVKPVWDERNRVSAVAVIPSAELGRPRIDVFLSALGYYRDNFPTRMKLLDQAIRTVSALDEKQNGVRTGTDAAYRRLVDHGTAPAEAKDLALARIFGYPDGQYGSAGYYYLLERSGDWDSREDLMDAYLSQVRNVYSGERWGVPAPEAYDAAMQGTEVVLRSWSDAMTSPLSNKYMWYVGGSLALAVKHVTGREPEFLLSDVRDPDKAEMISSESAVHRDLRVRLLNRKWIEGMQKEGYAGADQVAVAVGNMLGWKVMREGSVSNEDWRQVVETYVDDRLKLHTREWFEKENPFAFQEMLEVLLEAARKGHWKADAATVAKLSSLYADSEKRHGKGGGLRGGGNAKLSRFVEQALTAGPGKPTSATTDSAPAMDSARTSAESRRPGEATDRASEPEDKKGPPDQPAAPKQSEHVRGQRLSPSATPTAGPMQGEALPYVLGATCFGLFLFGFLKGRRRG